MLRAWCLDASCPSQRMQVLALVDSDPYGLKILSVYMKGACFGIPFIKEDVWWQRVRTTQNHSVLAA
jgi:DNA topoisomerase VI subunit A